jgi:hypothetical protein
LAAEEAASGSALEGARLKVDGYDYASIVDHIVLLEEAGLLKVRKLVLETGFVQDARVQRLTWEGHEFLAAARSDSVWTKTKKFVLEQGGGIAFSVVKELLLREMRQRVGLA